MDFSQFQFSQSAWLWGLLVIPLVILLYILFCKADSAKLLERFADQHLLPHLVKTRTVTGGGVRLSLLLWAVAWLCGVVAMAGPRWSYTDVPTFREAQSLVIVLDLSQTMNETDVKPSRIARAREEIQDLLDLSRGVSIGLVAYAAVPHMVTPLTDDLRTIKNLLPALDTSLVTIQGDRLKPALEMAAGMLKAQPGEDKSILVISDGGFEESDFAELAKAAGNATIYTMGIGGTMPLPGLGDGGERSQDTAGKKAIPLRADPLLRLATAGHGLYVEANYTDSDTRAVLGSIDAANVKTQTSPNMARVWDERFYIPVLALALLLLPLFRKGASFLAVILLAANFCFLAPARAASVTDLFLNKEEQAQAAYDRGDFKGAMAKFDTPYRQGVAAYRAGAYERAAILFKAAASQNGGLNALYDLGNAELMQGQVEDAIASYEAVLKQKPGHLGARHNLALALKMLPQKQDPQKKQDKNKSGDNKQGQNKQQGQQQSQQQGKNGQRSNQSPKSGAGNSARAKQSKDNQQAAQQRGQQQAGQQKPQQQAGLQQASPQGVKQRGAGAPQNSEIGMAASGPPRTQQDIDADEWLGRVQSDPGSFLRNQFIIEDRKSGLKQNAPPRMRFAFLFPAVFFLLPFAASAASIPSQINMDGSTVSISALVSSARPYQNQSIRYTVKCVMRGNISDASLGDIGVSNAIVERQGEPEVHDEVENGSTFRVIEFHFIITPLQPGEISIPPAVMQGKIRTPDIAVGASQFGDGLSRAMRQAMSFLSAFDDEPFSVASNTVQLEVKAPATAMDPWLPLTSLRIMDGAGTPQAVKVGEPLSRKITLLADGAVGGQLPDLEAKQDHKNFRVYADKPTTGEDVDQKGGVILGWRKESYTLIPQRSGRLVLPAIKVRWWDIVNNKVAVSELPERIVSVLPAAVAQNLRPAGTHATRRPAPMQSPKAGSAVSNVGSLISYGLVAILVGALSFAAVWAVRYWQQREGRRIGNVLVDTPAIPRQRKRASTPHAGRKLEHVRRAGELREFLQAYLYERYGISKNVSLEISFWMLSCSWIGREREDVDALIKELGAALYGGKDVDVEDLKRRSRRVIALLKRRSKGGQAGGKKLRDLNPS